MARARGLGPRGRRFESCHSDQTKKQIKLVIENIFPPILPHRHHHNRRLFL